MEIDICSYCLVAAKSIIFGHAFQEKMSPNVPRVGDAAPCAVCRAVL